MRRAFLALALAGCSSRELVSLPGLAPGDLVVGVALDGALAPTAVATALVGADGAAELELEGPSSALFGLRAADLVSPSGGPVSPADARLDLDGDDVAGCCTAPPISRPMIAAPGDRCALSPELPSALHPSGSTDPGPVLAGVLARLRVSWPGGTPRAAPALRPLTPRVCPIGEGARRHGFDGLAVADDGTITIATRGLVTHLSPEGATVETAILPPIHTPIAVATLGARSYFLGGLIGDRVDDKLELVAIPRDGSPAWRVEGVPGGFVPAGVETATRSGELWIFGRDHALNGTGALARCAVGEGPGARARCTVIELPTQTSCGHFGDTLPVDVVRELDGGDVVGLTAGGGLVPVPAGWDHARCIDGAEPVEVSFGGVPRSARFRGAHAVTAGRRLYACFVAPEEGISAVYTATIGALASARRVRWEQLLVREGGAYFCSGVHVDPRDGRGVIVSFEAEGELRGERVRIDGGEGRWTLREERDALYPELGELPVALELGGGLSVLGGLSGRLWSVRPVERPVERWGLAGGVTTPASAIEPDGSGFLVRLRGDDVLRVRVGAGDGCESVASDPFPAPRGTPIDAAITLAGAELRFLRSPDRAWIEVGGRELPLEGRGRVKRVVELAGGRWAAFLREDGALGATDGAEVLDLDPAGDGRWSDLDATDGVGWVVGAAGVARILPDHDGGLRLEGGVLERVDRSALDALDHDRAPIPEAVRAGSCGEALIGFDDDVLGLASHAAATTLWRVRPVAGGLSLSSYEGYDPVGPRALDDGIILRRILGPLESPLLLGWAEPLSSMLLPPNAPPVGLPFGRVTGAAMNGSELLLGSDHGRLALVRLGASAR